MYKVQVLICQLDRNYAIDKSFYVYVYIKKNETVKDAVNLVRNNLSKLNLGFGKHAGVSACSGLHYIKDEELFRSVDTFIGDKCIVDADGNKQMFSIVKTTQFNIVPGTIIADDYDDRKLPVRGTLLFGGENIKEEIKYVKL